MDTLDQPLLFRRIPIRTVWGGRGLERSPGLAFPPDVGPDEKVGETWEVVDRDDHNSTVVGGPHDGRSLRELMEHHGSELLGSVPPTTDGRFPLLVKFIDACDTLSVQVHPDDETAVTVGGEAKTEAWYILDAEPGAKLYAGLRADVDAASFAEASADERVVDMLLEWEVAGGQCLLIPGGTVHAIGAGITLLEVQQNSDTTFRLYDWGRVGLDGEPRETHVEQALGCVSFGEAERGPVAAEWERAGDGLRRAPMARSAYFGMTALSVEGAARFETGGQFQIYVVVGGAGRMRVRGSDTAHAMRPGDSWLVPAATDEHTIEAEGGELSLVQLNAQP